jgi:UDP-glucuronate decarboxylase
VESYLILGGAGFLGVNLTKALLEAGNFVCVVDNFFSSTRSNLDQFKAEENFTYIESDICNPWTDFPKSDYVVNLACPASPKYYQLDPIFTLTTSVLGTLNAITYCRKNDSVLVFSSTSEIYGDPTVPTQSETYWGNVNPIGIRACYDEGKRAAESLIFDARRMYGLDGRVVRIFNTYGPGMSAEDGRVVSNFINQALRDEPIELYGTGEQTRSFCFVDDTIAALMSICTTPTPIDFPINIGNPDEISMRTLAEVILDLTQSGSEIKFAPLPGDDPKLRHPDISRARLILHWDPQINLRQGLIQTVEYFKKLMIN